MPIKTLGKYELIEELGRGGFGTVYRARDISLDIERAIKVLHPALTASPEFIERFRREGRFTARLDHPNIVPVYELGEADGYNYLVMKYLPGGSLKELLTHQGALPFPQAVEITRQVANALTYAYQQPEKLIHRDLKPGNILFESLPGGAMKAVVRLSDFGFAKALSEVSTNSSSSSGGMLGTPAYMAPEVWRGKTVGPAVDQYALACALYEMLTGHTLFTGDSPPEIMTKHVLDGPEFPAVWAEGVPTNIEGVLRRALAVKPEERYPDVAAFSAACADLLAPPVVVVASPEPEKMPVPLPVETQSEPPVVVTAAPEPEQTPIILPVETQAEPLVEAPHPITQSAKTPSTQKPAWELGVQTTPPTTETPLRRVPSDSAQPPSGSKTIGWMWAIAAGLLIVTCIVVGANGGFGATARATDVPTEVPTEIVVEQPSPTLAPVIPPTEVPTSEPVIEDAVPPGEKVTIRWFVGLAAGSDPAQTPVEEEVVKDFNASQDRITLKLEVVPFKDARDTLSTQIAAGDGPDIIGPVGWAGANPYEGQWANLAPLIRQANFDTSIFDAALVKFYQVNGEQVGLPFAVYPGAMYFVPAMFDRANLSYPPQTYDENYILDGKPLAWNWDTVTEIAKRLTIDKNGKNATQSGFNPSQIVQVGYVPQFQTILSVATFYAGPAKIYEGDRVGNYKSAIPDSWKNAWKWYYDGIFGQQPFMLTGEMSGSPEFGQGNVFDSGKAAMALTQSWYTCCMGEFVNAGNQFQLGIQPTGSDRLVHGRVDADTFRMWKGSKNPNAAFTVMAYLITKGADKLLPAYGAMPAIASKTDAFFAQKSADYPFVTKASWNVFIQGLSYPDTPSAEQFQPNWNEASVREQTFMDLLNNTVPDQLNFYVEFQKMVDDLNVIYNK